MTTSRLACSTGSTQISQLLLEVVGPRVCLVEVSRAEGCFTYAVDAAWAEMGLGLVEGNQHDDELSSLQLPRSALQAVIAGWPADWDKAEKPRLEVHLSEDLVPHVSVLEDQRVSGRWN